MTIREFARLCGCNPQTLRYYDQVELLKPAKVDKWSGYRFYKEEQALAFVKIKNLQRAGFTIEEIKGLLDKDNQVVFEAFEAKIAEAEERLLEIRNIQRSYQSEMEDIRKKIDEVREVIMGAMGQFDAWEEFGIGGEEYAAIVENVKRCFDTIAESKPKDIGYALDGDDGEAVDYAADSDHELLYEKHGWARVGDFLDEFCRLESDGAYVLCFRMDEKKDAMNTAFCNTVLGVMLARNPGRRVSLSCTVQPSEDGKNHFWLYRHK